MADVIHLVEGDTFLTWYGLRQRKLARLRCAAGHAMEARSSVHLGQWRACTRCGLLELLDG